MGNTHKNYLKKQRQGKKKAMAQLTAESQKLLEEKVFKDIPESIRKHADASIYSSLLQRR